jgi:hypothetical protein
MKLVNTNYAGAKPAETRANPVWRVAPAQPTARRAGPFARLLRREQPSTFHRCLAVHLYFASARGGLS